MDVYTTCYRHQTEIDVLMNKTHSRQIITKNGVGVLTSARNAQASDNISNNQSSSNIHSFTLRLLPHCRRARHPHFPLCQVLPQL